MSGDGRETEALFEGESLKDILVVRAGRTLPMLGLAGPERELSFLPPEHRLFPGRESGGLPGRTPQKCLPVLLGAGAGPGLQELVRRLEEAHGPDFFLAVIDKERDILDAAGHRERLAFHPGVFWMTGDDQEEALKTLTLWQDTHQGLPLLPVVNPFYLRLDRDFYSFLHKACDASSRADFWARARQPRFTRGKARILLLSSKYFLMGEILSACARLDIPHHFVQVPEGEVGHGEFVEQLLAAVVSFAPDFVFTINHLGVDREGVLVRLLEKLRLPLASWFVDNPHLVLSLYTGLVNPWTAIFTWDADNLESLSALGFEHVSYLPLGTDATRFAPPADGSAPSFPGLPGTWDGQVSFVGNSMVSKVEERLRRVSLPKALTVEYQAVAAGFAGGEERSVREYLASRHPGLVDAFDALGSVEDKLGYETMLTWEATRQYRLSCVRETLPFHPLIVGDPGWHALLGGETGWQYHSELNYYDDLPRFYPCTAVNFNCTSKQMKGAVNQRVFDVPATGAFLLTDYREQVERLFESGREIVCYREPAEAGELLQRFTASPEERRAVALAARKRILAEHTYDHRVRDLIAAMRRIYG